MIALGCDHGGYGILSAVRNYLDEKGIEYKNFGCFSEESVDYPLYAFKLGKLITSKNADFGIAICGTGIGISIACNKVKGIRCAKVDRIEEAEATRKDNDANIIAFGEKMTLSKALELIEKFINTKASDEEKHVRRRQKIAKYEEQQC